MDQQSSTAAISVGIDVGKDELVACVRCSNGTIVPPVAFPNSPYGIRKLLRNFAEQSVPSTAPVLLESTGPYHWNVARTLADKNFLAKVVNPLHSKQIARHSVRKRKTDKVDAAQLAFLASQGYGYPFVETKELAHQKALVRHYWSLWRLARAQQLHEKYLAEYRDIRQFRLTPLIERRLEILEEKIVRECACRDLTLLDSIPGITPLLAATILTEIAPLSRFAGVEQLVAYSGLDPSVKQSGGKPARHGRLSKRGSPVLRETLFLAAFGSFLHEPFCRTYRHHRARGIHHVAAICILARKILRISFALLTKRQLFSATLCEMELDPSKPPQIVMS